MKDELDPASEDMPVKKKRDFLSISLPIFLWAVTISLTAFVLHAIWIAISGLSFRIGG
jgi:hypothetical protein